jgi:hypothetical protein
MALTHSASSTSIDDGGEISRRKRANANSKNRQKTNGLGEAGASDETNQNEPEKKREDTPPAPSRGEGAGLGEHVDRKSDRWSEFQLAWPIGGQLNAQTERIFTALAPEDQAHAVAGAAEYCREMRAENFKLSARRYLADRRWVGLKVPAKPTNLGPAMRLRDLAGERGMGGMARVFRGARRR